LKIGTTDRTETSANYYQYSLHNNPRREQTSFTLRCKLEIRRN